MDSNTIASLLQTRRRLLNRKLAVGLVVAFLFWPTAMTHLFFWRIEHLLSLKVRGKPLITMIPGSARLSGNFVEWKDHLRVKSGTLSIRFPISTFFRAEYPIVLDGQNLTVEFGPDLAKTLGRSEMFFDQIRARVIIQSKKGVDIDYLDAQSKTIQFHLAGSQAKASGLEAQN